LLVWCLSRLFLGIATLAAGGRANQDNGGLSDIALSFLYIPIFAGIDFIIMMGGSKSVTIYRAAFCSSLLQTLISYFRTLCSQNLCEEVKLSGAAVIIRVLYYVVDAGLRLALMKLLFKKIRRTYPPALRYGISSHILISLPPPGGKADLIMSDGDVVIMPSGGAVTEIGQIVFSSPSGGFHRSIIVWSLVAMVWACVAICQTILEVSILRAKPLEQCWETVSNFKAQPILATINPALAAALIASLTTLILVHRLGRVCWGWLPYWYRRNWILVLITFFRGFTFVRPDYPTSQWMAQIINYSAILCVALSIVDIILLFAPSRILKAMYRLFILSQIIASISSYLVGSSLGSPCDKSRLSPSTAWFIANKVQTSITLFHSLFLLQLLVRVKIFEGVAVPIIDFSACRFSEQSVLPKHRISRIESLREGGVVEMTSL
jgi:hypothetical protein